jgi:hypothetical protein
MRVGVAKPATREIAMRVAGRRKPQETSRRQPGLKSHPDHGSTGIRQVPSEALPGVGLRDRGSPAFPEWVEDAQVKAGELKITPLKAIISEATSHAPPRSARARHRTRRRAGC